MTDPTRRANPGRMGVRRRLRAAFVGLLLPGLLLGGPGCTRRFFRERADKEVDALLVEKSDDLRWPLHEAHVYPDPRARFADPTCPDRPPMPPDDPGARDLSPTPQKPGKAGVASVEGVGYLDLLEAWDQENRARLEQERAREREEDGAAASEAAKALADAEARTRRELADAVSTTGTLSPEEVQRAASRERPFLLKIEQAVELGLVNSREYQTRREQLYLAALPVTLERFAFGAQLFAAGQAFRERSGRETPEGFTNRWRLNSTVGFTKLFSTGALLLVGFANRTVINLGGARDTSVSTLSADLIQPFLRGGGRAVTLEPLTQVERNLLYAIRDFAKFRQEFFVFIAAGQPSFIPGQQAGVAAITGGTIGLPTGFVPLATPLADPLGANPVFPQVTPGRGVQFGDVFGPAAPPQGYLSNLFAKAQLVNQYRNNDSLRRFLELFTAYEEGGLVTRVQVGTVEQSLLNSIRSVLTGQANYRNSLDQFKLQLGLPLSVPIELDDEPLRPLFQVTERFEDVSASFEAASSEALRYGRPDEVRQLRGRLRKLLTASRLVRGTKFRERVDRRWRAWQELPGPVKEGDKDPLGELLLKLFRQRLELLEKRAKAGDGGLAAADERRLAAIEFEFTLGQLERALRAYERQPWLAEKEPALRQAAQARAFVAVYRIVLAILEEAFRERQEAVGQMWPELPALCVDGVDLLRDDDDAALAAVTRAALTNRLDLMNQRAQLVDSWRKLAVAANALLGTFNVEYHVDAFTPLDGNQPLRFGGSRTRNQLILNGELPLVRIAERNNYRAALISYQQQRRQLQIAEDQVLFAVRLELRQLRAQANNYHRVQKRAVQLAYRQVDQALQAFSQPQAPPGPERVPGLVGAPGGGPGGGDPAALTQQLLSTQNSLLGAQNDLYNTWIGYLTTRMSLYRDLGLMPLDPRGVWIDDVATCACRRVEPPLTSSDRPDGRGDGERGQWLPPPRPAPEGAGGAERPR